MMEHDVRRESDKEVGEAGAPIAFVRTVAAAAVVAFALLVVTDGRSVLPFALGIAGLILVAAALAAMDGFRQRWRRVNPADQNELQGDITANIPLLVEAGLWGLGVLYVIELLERARG